MARDRTHSVAIERRVAQEFLAGETLHGLARRHELSWNLIRVWVEKFEAGAFDEDTQAADLIQEYEARSPRSSGWSASRRSSSSF